MFERRAVTTLFAGAMVAGCTLWADVAAADGAGVHADFGVEGGVMRRFLTSRAGESDASFGPALEVHGHIAVLPMLRAGLYLATDISPQAGAPARHFYSGGLRAKIMPPWIRTDVVSTWFFTGFGYASMYAPSFHRDTTKMSDPTRTVDQFFGGAPGHFFEVPIGVGASWRLRKPWNLFAELGGRVGFAHAGPFYDGRTATASGEADSTLTRGNDAFSLFLTIGVELDL